MGLPRRRAAPIRQRLLARNRSRRRNCFHSELDGGTTTGSPDACPLECALLLRSVRETNPLCSCRASGRGRVCSSRTRDTSLALPRVRAFCRRRSSRAGFLDRRRETHVQIAIVAQRRPAGAFFAEGQDSSMATRTPRLERVLPSACAISIAGERPRGRSAVARRLGERIHSAVVGRPGVGALLVANARYKSRAAESASVLRQRSSRAGFLDRRRETHVQIAIVAQRRSADAIFVEDWTHSMTRSR